MTNFLIGLSVSALYIIFDLSNSEACIYFTFIMSYGIIGVFCGILGYIIGNISASWSKRQRNE